MNKQKILLGYDSIKKLKSIIETKKSKSLFVVSGKSSYIDCGAKKIFSVLLMSYNLTRFNNFQVNPQIEDIEKGIALFKKEKYDLIIAIGGGSVLDTAKAINILSEQKNPKECVLGKKECLPKRRCLIAIPTTAGTGSESTQFSVIYMNKTKYSLAHSSMLPEYVILDPTFTLNLSRQLTAVTGMDAICQAIESMWSINSTEESRTYSKEALKLLVPNIVQAVINPNKSVRESMLIGSNYAGQAINIAKTTAAHAISYSFTTNFGIPHGHAVALTLPYFFPYNYHVDKITLQDSRGAAFVKKQIDIITNLLGVKIPEEAQEKILQIMKQIGLETKLSELGIDEQNIQKILNQGFNLQRAKNNPRLFTENDFKELLLKI